MGAVGMGFVMGASAYWIAIGCILGYAFNWFFIAEKLRKKSRDSSSITLPDFLESQSSVSGKAVRIISVIILFLFMFTYVSAQLTAAGEAFRAIFNIRYEFGVLIGAGIVIIYTAIGGYRAVSWTDLIQGLMMVIALVVVPVLAISTIGGVDNLYNQLEKEKVKSFCQFRGEVDGQYQNFGFDREIFAGINEQGKIDFSKSSKVFRDMKIAEISVKNRKVGDKQVSYCVINKIEDNAIDEDRIPPIKVGDKFLRTSLEINKNDEIIFGKDSKLTFYNSKSLKDGSKLIDMFGGESGLTLIGFLIGMLGIGFGYPGAPHVLVRYMSAKSMREIKRGRVIALSWGVLAQFGAITMGLAVRILSNQPEILDIKDPEHGLLTAAVSLMHPVLAGLIFAAVFSAICSTADSELLIASSSVTRDLYQKLFKKKLTEKKMVWMSQSIVIILGFLALLLALPKIDIIFWFVLFSWSGLGASFGPIVILSLYWKKITTQGMIAGMLTGTIVTIVWYFIKVPMSDVIGFSLYELVPAFILAFLMTYIVSSMTYKEK